MPKEVSVDFLQWIKLQLSFYHEASRKKEFKGEFKILEETKLSQFQ